MREVHQCGDGDAGSKRGTQGFVIRDTKARKLNRKWGEVQVPKLGCSGA